MSEEKITVGKLESSCNNQAYRGGYIQINNLLVEATLSDDGLGYIVNIYSINSEEALHSYTVHKQDLLPKYDGNYISKF